MNIAPPRRHRPFRRLLVIALLVGHLSAQWAAGAEPLPLAVTNVSGNRDVRLLGPQQALVVRVVDAQGKPHASQLVVLQQGRRVLIQGVTDHAGRVAFAGVRGGTYSLAVGDRALGIRAWTPPAAPPVAADELVITPQEGPYVARGQDPWYVLFGPEPILLGVLIAAAIAIPIAVHESGSDDAPPGS